MHSFILYVLYADARKKRAFCPQKSHALTHKRLARGKRRILADFFPFENLFHKPTSRVVLFFFMRLCSPPIALRYLL